MPQIHIVQRSYFGVVLLLIATASYLQARGITLLLGSLLIQDVSPARRARVATRAPAVKTADALRAHNVFDSSTPAVAPPRRDFSDPLAWPQCEGVQAVIVTESSDPHWSVASLRGSDGAPAQLRRAGDSAAGKRVAFVGFNQRQQAPAVWLEDAEAPCQALLFREAPRSPLPLAVASAHDNPVAVERPRDEGALVDRSRLLRSVRVVPEVKDGKTVGLRLFGIRPETLLGRLGLRSGDRLEAINGFEVSNPEKALQAYARLRTAPQLRLRLVRGGSPIELTVNVI
jgi:general secretion pathway protein C